MEICELEIPDIKLIVPKRFSDARGDFCETWNDRLFREKIANVTFVQDNESVSARKRTLRGLHSQTPPFAQGKLVHVIRGSILDVTVDIRHGSPTYRQQVTVKLDALAGEQLWVPPSFLHDFCTLEDDTAVCYKVTSCYSPDYEAGVVWNDEDLGINWPVDTDSVVLSDKDKRLPHLRDLPIHFR